MYSEAIHSTGPCSYEEKSITCTVPAHIRDKIVKDEFIDLSLFLSGIRYSVSGEQDKSNNKKFQIRPIDNRTNAPNKLDFSTEFLIVYEKKRPNA